MGSFLKKNRLHFLFAFLNGLLLIGCSGGSMGPGALGGSNNAATPNMPTGVSVSTSDYGGKHTSLLLTGEVDKNAPSQDPTAMPYHTHMTGSLACNITQYGSFCYGG